MSAFALLSTSAIAGAIGGLVAVTGFLLESETTETMVDKQYASLTATAVQVVAPSGEWRRNVFKHGRVHVGRVPFQHIDVRWVQRKRQQQQQSICKSIFDFVRCCRGMWCHRGLWTNRRWRCFATVSGSRPAMPRRCTWDPSRHLPWKCGYVPTLSCRCKLATPFRWKFKTLAHRESLCLHPVAKVGTFQPWPSLNCETAIITIRSIHKKQFENKNFFFSKQFKIFC